MTARATWQIWLTGAMVLGASMPVRSQQPASVRLTPEEQQALARIDPKMAEQILALAASADGWRKDIEAYKAAVKAAADRRVDDLLETGKDQIEAEVILRAAQAIGKVSPEARALIGVGDDIQKLTVAAEERLRSIRFDPGINFDLTKEDFEATVRSAVMAQLAGKVLSEIEKALSLVEKAKNPAQYARNFLENEVKKKYMTKPYDFGEIKLAITQTDFKKSLFAPDANIAVVIDYGAIGFQVKATGLYFKVGANGTPVPAIDKLKVEQNALDLLTGKALKSLGDALPDFGLPIQVKNPRISGFDGSDAAKRGAISFRIVLGFGELLNVKPADLIKAEADVTVSLAGKIELGPDGLKGTANIETPLPPTPLSLHGYTLQVRPKDKDKPTTIGTVLAPASAAGKNTVSMKVEISIGFPITTRGITIDGTLLVGGTVGVGTVNARITKEKMTGTLKMPSVGSPIPTSVFDADFKFTLDKSGFVADGSAHLFKVVGRQVSMMMKFNGEATLSTKESFRLAGVSVNSTLDVRVQEGFRKINLDATFSADVDLKYRKLSAAVEVKAQYPGKPVVEVAARAGGVDVDFTLNDLDDLTPHRLALEFLKRLDKLLDNFASALADLEKQGAKSLAKAEKAFRDRVSADFKRAGLDKVSTGNKALDDRLGELAQGGKNVIEWGVNSREKGGKWLAEMRQNPGGTLAGSIKSLEKDISNLGSEISNLSDKVGGLLGDPAAKKRLNKKKEEKADRERELAEAKKKAAEQERLDGEATRVLTRLIQSLNGVDGVIQRLPPAYKPGDKKPDSLTSLEIDCENAVSDSVENTKDAVVMFLFHARGYTVSKSARRSASDVKSGVVRFTSLLDPSAKPKARIELPEFAHGSSLPGRQLLFDRIADLIERLLPNVDIEGRQRERIVVFENKTEERVHVWVQAFTQVTTERGREWAWRPAGPGDSHDADVMTLLPGERKTVTRKSSSNLGGLAKVTLPVPIPVSASKVRYWAETESGRSWTKYENEDRWLVEPQPDGRRFYRAAAKEEFVLSLTASDGKRTWHERAITVRNETTRPLSVSASARTKKPGGDAGSANAKTITIEPGKSATLHKSDGWLLHGSAVQIWASDEKNEHWRWLANKSTSLTLADSNGYSGEKIGYAEFVLDEPTSAVSKPTGLDSQRVTFRLPADTVKVPALERKLVKEAEGALSRAGLRARTPAGTEPGDTVISASPDGWVATKAEIALVSGVMIPVLKDQPAKTAESRLSALKVAFQTKPVQRMTENANLVNSSVVTGQSASGLVRRPASVILDVVSYVPLTVEVPALQGKTLAQAEAMLKNARLNLRVLNDPKAGPVLAQDPAAGTRVTPNTVVVARFPMPMPKMVAVPNLVRMTPDEARQAARQAGLDARVVSGSTADAANPAMVGKAFITGQSVAQGQMVAPGTVINLQSVTYVAPMPAGDVRGSWKAIRINVVNRVKIVNGMKVTEAQRVAQDFAIYHLRAEGVAEAQAIVLPGGNPGRPSRGSYRLASDMLMLQFADIAPNRPSQYRLSGKIRWINKEKFILTTLEGIEFEFVAVQFK